MSSAFELDKARQKRALAAQLRAVAPGMSVAADRETLLQQAVSLEAEATQIEAGFMRQQSQPTVFEQQQVQEQKGNGEDC